MAISDAVYDLFPNPEEVKKVVDSRVLNKNKIKIIYELYGYCLEDEDMNVRDILRSNKFEWKNECYVDEMSNIKEQRNFIENPPQVAEGVISCSKCGSKRVYCQSVQSRSGDEGMNVRARCTKCNNVWSQRG